MNQIFIGRERRYMTGAYKLNLFPRRKEIAIPAPMSENINIIGRQSASSEVTPLSFGE